MFPTANSVGEAFPSLISGGMSCKFGAILAMNYNIKFSGEKKHGIGRRVGTNTEKVSGWLIEPCM